MDYINFSSTMNMLDLIRFSLQESNFSFSFYGGNLSPNNEGSLNSSLMVNVCQYVCKRVREEWTVHNIGIISNDSSEVMICVTSPDPSMPAEVVSFIVEAVAINSLNMSNTAGAKTGMDVDKSVPDEEMVENISSDLIQVNATMGEIRERIEQFIQYKRSQTNANNIVEFCGPSGQGQFCARVDAILSRKKDSSSHMSVRNVLDRYTSKYNTAKVSPNETSNITTHLKNQASMPAQNAFVSNSPKGDKRTYDVASMESKLNIVKKQQKT